MQRLTKKEIAELRKRTEIVGTDYQVNKRFAHGQRMQKSRLSKCNQMTLGLLTGMTVREE